MGMGTYSALHFGDYLTDEYVGTGGCDDAGTCAADAGGCVGAIGEVGWENGASGGGCSANSSWCYGWDGGDGSLSCGSVHDQCFSSRNIWKGWVYWRALTVTVVMGWVARLFNDSVKVVVVVRFTVVAAGM